MANMTALSAQERLRQGTANLTPQGLYELMLAATGDERAANDAMSARISEIMRRGEKPEI